MGLLDGKNILIADDEEGLREVLSEIFMDQGANVSTAENGTVAFEVAKSKKFDVVISDVRMPGGDGVALVENLKSFGASRPKIFMCSGFSDITPEKAKDLGVIEIFPKPFSSREVVKAVCRSLGIV